MTEGLSLFIRAFRGTVSRATSLLRVRPLHVWPSGDEKMIRLLLQLFTFVTIYVPAALLGSTLIFIHSLIFFDRSEPGGVDFLLGNALAFIIAAAMAFWLVPKVWHDRCWRLLLGCAAFSVWCGMLVPVVYVLTGGD